MATELQHNKAAVDALVALNFDKATAQLILDSSEAVYRNPSFQALQHGLLRPGQAVPPDLTKDLRAWLFHVTTGSERQDKAFIGPALREYWLAETLEASLRTGRAPTVEMYVQPLPDPYTRQFIATGYPPLKTRLETNFASLNRILKQFCPGFEIRVAIGDMYPHLPIDENFEPSRRLRWGGEPEEPKKVEQGKKLTILDKAASKLPWNKK